MWLRRILSAETCNRDEAWQTVMTIDQYASDGPHERQREAGESPPASSENRVSMGELSMRVASKMWSKVEQDLERVDRTELDIPDDD